MLRLFLALPGALLGLLLVLPALVMAAPLWTVRGLVQAAQRWLEPQAMPKKDVMEFDPVLGWKGRPGLNAHLLIDGDDIYPIRTDEEGWPVTPAPRVEEAGLVVVGDSFAFGHGVRQGEAFFEVAPELRIKALGAPGYDMVQEFLIIREMGSRLRGKLVVWLVYVENDLTDSLRPHWLGYRKPFAQKPAGSEEWSIRSDHLSSRPWRASGPSTDWAQFAELCTPGPFAERHYSASAYLAAHGARVCREAGAEGLIIVTIPNVNQLEEEGSAFLRGLSPDPERFDVALPHRRFEELCAAAGISHVSGLDHFRARDYKRFERFHWNARGHQRAADLLEDLKHQWDAGQLSPSESAMKDVVSGISPS